MIKKTSLKRIISLLLLFALVVVGALISQKGIFNIWAVIVPLFFPRVAIVFRPYFKMLDADEVSVSGEPNIEDIEKSEEKSEENLEIDADTEGGKLDE